MNSLTKTLAVAATSGLLIAAAASAASAGVHVQYGSPYYYTGGVPVRVQLGNSYEDSHGHYRSQSDFIRDLNGTPCGVECTRRAFENP